METTGAFHLKRRLKDRSCKRLQTFNEFDYLGVVIYVQVKKHDGDTDSWAVEQIRNTGNSRLKVSLTE